MKRHKLHVKILIIIGLICGAIWAAFPVFWMLISSFKPNKDIFSWPPTIISPNGSLEAYAKVFHNSEQMRFFLNSYVIAACVVVLTLVVAIFASYGFSRFNSRAKELSIRSLSVFRQSRL